MTRSLTSAMATERARLTVAGARHYPGLLPGTWYEVAPGTEAGGRASAFGGVFGVGGGEDVELLGWGDDLDDLKDLSGR